MNDLEQRIHGRWFPQHVLDTHPLPDLLGIVGYPGERHDWDVGDRGIRELLFAKPPAIRSRHANVEHDHAHIRPQPQQCKRLLAVGSLTRLVSLEPEQLRESLPGAWGIVDNQHCRRLSHGPF